MPQQKPDSAKFSAFIQSLCKQDWLGPSRSWWPKRLVHFTNLTNAVQILNSGELLSRHLASSNREIALSAADPDIIAGTRSEIVNKVRLYFKPRPPMLYNVEGFRPGKVNAHIPVPIVFLFNSEKVLSLKNSQFSEGNLAASEVSLMSTAEQFEQMPFKKIYHDSALSDESSKRNILFHRHAEVVIPDRLSLDGHLENLWCRSNAEFETLLELLPGKAFYKYRNKIGVNARYSLFYEKWTHIREVSLSDSTIIINFKLAESASDRGPFVFRIELSDCEKIPGEIYFTEESNFRINDSYRLNIENVPFRRNYKIKIMLDGQLAYLNSYPKMEIF